MSDGISIDIGSLLPYVEEKARALFGDDYRKREAGAILEKHLRIAARDAASVQIVGMDRPVSIFEIYQPTRLRSPRPAEGELLFADLLKQHADAVIFGGPGTGKTVFTHYVFAQLSRRSGGEVPILFTLRWPDASEDLEVFIKNLAENNLKRLKKARILLLVDGYDEIGSKERQRVAAALRDFSSLQAGNFYLTCRTYYNADEVKGHRFTIAPFTRRDSTKFIAAFAKAYRTKLSGRKLLSELDKRGFADFAAHPLMLALVCILKSGPLPALPKTAIGLIRRAISTLTLRWDESKGVHRESRVGVDGEDRVRCMMRVAFEMSALVASDQFVQQVTRAFLRLLQKPEVQPHAFLTELAQWYGMLVPVSDSSWGFVHRTIHDFLAASYWVETGKFDPRMVASWNSRAAYAACLLPDATSSMVAALTTAADINAFVECLYNGALFEPLPVAIAVTDHFRIHKHFAVARTFDEVSVHTEQDFFGQASAEFLEALVTVGLATDTPPHQLVLAFALAELESRSLALSPKNRAQLHVAYPKGAAFLVKRADRVIRIQTADLREPRRLTSR